MKILVLDTETSGLLKHELPPRHPAQPWPVEIAAVLVETSDWSEAARFSLLVDLPEKTEIPESATRIHGITTERCRTYGVHPRTIASLLNMLTVRADAIVGHNVQYDISVLLAFYARLDIAHRFERVGLRCTMKLAEPILKLPFANGSTGRNFDGSTKYRWPKLEEAYEHLFGEPLVGAHSALVDVEATLRVYRALVEGGHVEHA